MGSESNSSRAVALLSPAVGEEHNVGDHLIDLAIRRFFDPAMEFQSFTTRRTLHASEIEQLNACQCALVCGTNLYQKDWPCALTTEVLEAIKIPVVPFGVGSSAATLEERSLSQQSATMIRALHDHCEVGSVRDPHTAGIVSSAGVKNFKLTGCPVLFWAHAGELPAVRPMPRSRIVVTARNWLMHRWPDAVDHPVQREFLRRVFDSFPADQMVYAIHEDYDERLVEALDIPGSSVFQSDRAADYVPLYTNPENLVMAMRLHAGMLALANGSPAVFIGHDTRTYSFCQMMGLDYVELFSDNSSEECVRRMRQILESDVSSFAATAARFRELRQEMKSFLIANRIPPAIG